MNLQKYKFAEVNWYVPTDENLLKEAKARGFYCRDTRYNELFRELFFHGGKLNYKEDLNPEFKENATAYLRAFMQSFEPRQEEKEAISALILSELVV